MTRKVPEPHGVRYQLWLVALSALVGLLIASHIASFWFILHLRTQCNDGDGDKPTINVDSTARLLSTKAMDVFKSNGRDRRQAESAAKKTLLNAFMDVLKQLCAPKERYCMLGPKGDQGFPGQPGDSGETGKNGGRGSAGKQGPKGDLGHKGNEGDKGINGLIGQPGAKGEQGVKGQKGEQGLQLVKEQKGSHTERKGQKGEAGTKGDKGEQGIKGEKGTKGHFKGGKVIPLPRPCVPKNYHVLSDEWRKISVSSKGQSLHCDSDLASGWYRFSESIGGQMNAKCEPQGGRCGTIATGWLVGSHPSTVGIEVSREVQYGYGSSCKNGNLATTVQIVNCGSYYVYYLQKTPGCFFAYCSSA